MMNRFFLLLLLSSAACFPATVQTFYSQSACNDAVRSGSFVTESFSGNQINTPGLVATVCSDADAQVLCAPSSVPRIDTTFIIENNQVVTYIGHEDGIDWTTRFDLPYSVTAVGLDLSADPTTRGLTFGFSFTSPSGYVASLYPFGGVGSMFPNPSYAYTGFLGFVSDTPFNSLGLDFFPGNSLGFDVTIDNLTFGDPTPEPATLGLIGLPLAGLLLFGRFRIERLLTMGVRTVFFSAVLLLSSIAYSAPLQTFFSESAFNDAVHSGSFTTESFSGNQINTPGLTISLCGEPDQVTTITCVAPNVNLSDLNSVRLVNNRVEGRVGFFEGVYFDVTFNLPEFVTAIGFDFSGASGTTPPLSSPTPISFGLGADQSVSPFGNIAEPNPGPYSFPYSGFLGFISSEPFDSLSLGGAGIDGGDVFTVDNLTFGDPTPEPATWRLIALSGIGLMLVHLRRYALRGQLEDAFRKNRQIQGWSA